MDGTFQTAVWLGWIKQLPEDVIRLRPVLCAQIGWAFSNAGEPVTSEIYLQYAERALSGATDRIEVKPLPGSIALARAYNAQVQGNLAETVKYAELAAQLIPADDVYHRAQAAITLNFTHWATGNLEAAQRAIHEWMASMTQLARVLIHHYSGAPGREDALHAVIAHPLCTIETDTFLTRRGHQNPASYGTFPRVLGGLVRAGLFGLEEAVHRMTGAAAARLGLRDRGSVRPGAAADLVVFDPARLRDEASFTDPARFPTGIEHVWINGRHVLEGDRYDAGARAGRVLRVRFRLAAAHPACHAGSRGERLG